MHGPPLGRDLIHDVGGARHRLLVSALSARAWAQQLPGAAPGRRSATPPPGAAGAAVPGAAPRRSGQPLQPLQEPKGPEAPAAARRDAGGRRVAA